MQIGANRDFDPEIYRKQIREYQVSKVEGPRRAYVGAGNILCHADESNGRPPTAPALSHASVGESTKYTGDMSPQADVMCGVTGPSHEHEGQYE